GIQGVDMDFWLGMLAPAATPVPTVERYNSVLNDILRTPRIADTLKAQGFVAVGGSARFRRAHREGSCEVAQGCQRRWHLTGVIGDVGGARGCAGRRGWRRPRRHGACYRAWPAQHPRHRGGALCRPAEYPEGAEPHPADDGTFPLLGG